MYKKVFIFISLILIFLLNITYIFSENSYILTFNDYKSNKIIFSFRIKDEDKFIITYKHSVALTPIYEFYKIQKGKIVLYEFHFYDQCAGLPTEPIGKEILINENGIFKLKNMERIFENIIYGIYEKGDFKLIFKNNIINLSEKLGSRFIIIKIRRN
ncbi:MAG: DUF1850 domain-containing protein [Caldisericia bacterium]|nr:DUF1850 domain-containing protein [Caldisericia bacterium]